MGTGVRLSIRMGKKGELRDFKSAMFVGASQIRLNILETADLLDFPHTTTSGPKKRTFPVSRSTLSENALLIRGQRRMSRML